MGTCADQICADMQAIQEAGAGGVDIQCRGVSCTECIRNQRGSVGTHGIVGQAAQQDQIKFAGIEVGRCQCTTGGDQSHV